MTQQQVISSVLPEKLINAPRLKKHLESLAQEHNIELIEYEYFGMLFPFNLGTSNKVTVENNQMSIVVNIY